MSSVTDVTKAIGSERKTVTTAQAIGITTVYSGISATKATLTVENADIRYYQHGVDPTPVDGHYIGAGLQFIITGITNLEQFRMIATSGSAIVTITVEAPEV
jgi:hypothetical protein